MTGCLIIKLINIVGKGKFVAGLMDTPLQSFQRHIIKDHLKGFKISDDNYYEEYSKAIYKANKAIIYPLDHKK